MALLYSKKLIALCGATLAVAAAAPTALAAAGTKVTVRVEGLHRTLLSSKSVKTHGGWITKDGTPKGACPATSATGALDVATHHRWGGTYTSEGLEILTILGERHPFNPPKDFWEVFVNERPASVGACEQKLRRGERLLFAAVPDSTVEYAVAIRAPRTAAAGHPFAVKVVWWGASGKAKPLAGARVTAAGTTSTTNSQGTVELTAAAGTLVIHASKKDYIRAAPARVRVSS